MDSNAETYRSVHERLYALQSTITELDSLLSELRKKNDQNSLHKCEGLKREIEELYRPFLDEGNKNRLMLIYKKGLKKKVCFQQEWRVWIYCRHGKGSIKSN